MFGPGLVVGDDLLELAASQDVQRVEQPDIQTHHLYRGHALFENLPNLFVPRDDLLHRVGHPAQKRQVLAHVEWVVLDQKALVASEVCHFRRKPYELDFQEGFHKRLRIAVGFAVFAYILENKHQKHEAKVSRRLFIGAELEQILEQLQVDLELL